MNKSNENAISEDKCTWDDDEFQQLSRSSFLTRIAILLKKESFVDCPELMNWLSLYVTLPLESVCKKEHSQANSITILNSFRALH